MFKHIIIEVRESHATAAQEGDTMTRWFLGMALLVVVGGLGGCGQDSLRKERAALASSSARLDSRESVLDARESSLDRVRASSESESVAESESKEEAESSSQEKADSQAESTSAKLKSQADSTSAELSRQAESVSSAAESVSQNQINSPVQAVDWVIQQRGEQDSKGKITWQAGAAGDKDGQQYFAVQGKREDNKDDAALDLLVVGTGEIVARDSAAGKALTE